MKDEATKMREVKIELLRGILVMLEVALAVALVNLASGDAQAGRYRRE